VPTRCGAIGIGSVSARSPRARRDRVLEWRLTLGDKKRDSRTRDYDHRAPPSDRRYSGCQKRLRNSIDQRRSGSSATRQKKTVGRDSIRDVMGAVAGTMMRAERESSFTFIDAAARRERNSHHQLRCGIVMAGERRTHAFAALASRVIVPDRSARAPARHILLRVAA